jgi:hypothetical protein
MGLGAALVMLVLLFATNLMRSNSTDSRWWDPVWLAWLTVPMYLLHVFEEYSHDILGRVYFIADNVCQAQGYSVYPDCPIPTAHYPLVNIALVWVAAPLAAWLSKRNLVIGLTFYGLILFNGILHVATGLTMGSDAYPGMVTGSLLFIPITLWMIYACLKSHVMTAKAIAISLAGGIVGHIVLGLSYLVFKLSGSAAVMFMMDVACVTIPFLIAGLGSKLLLTQVPRPLTGA